MKPLKMTFPSFIVHKQTIVSLLFSLDLVSFLFFPVFSWNSFSETPVIHLEAVLWMDIQSPVSVMKLSPDDSLLAIADKKGRLQVWDVVIKSRKFQLKWANTCITSLTFDKDSHECRYLYAGLGDGKIALIDLHTGIVQKEKSVHEQAVYNMTKGITKDILFTCSYDKSVFLLDGKTLEVIQKLIIPDIPTGLLSIHADSFLVISTIHKKIEVYHWQTEQFQYHCLHQDEIWHLAFDEESDTIISLDWSGKLIQWNFQSNQIRFLNSISWHPWDMNFFADSQRLFIAQDNGQILYYDNNSQNMASLIQMNNPIYDIETAKNQREIWAAEKEGQIHYISVQWFNEKK